ncbi:MAG: rhodanese-like domain-containing protein [Gemmataceae bacterium]
MGSVTVEELRGRLDRGEEVCLLDVREPAEWELCRLPGAMLIPLGQLPQRFTELDSKRETVVMCHHGVRSQWAIGFLARQGFTNLLNLAGGIHAWAVRVDPTMARY